jgi:hypothetical protein
MQLREGCVVVSGATNELTPWKRWESCGRPDSQEDDGSGVGGNGAALEGARGDKH